MTLGLCASSIRGHGSKTMFRPRLLTPRQAAEILSISYPTIKNWIYKGKFRTMKIPGGHHRIPEEDIEKHLRATLGAGGRDKWRIASDRISESNQMVGRILGIQVDGLVAQVTLSNRGLSPDLNHYG